jgi:hypothetical protein
VGASAGERRIKQRRRQRFLAALAEHGCVTWAARAAGYARQYVYELRAAEPTFAQAWDDAREEAADHLEHEAWRRALVGVEVPMVHQGVVVGTYKRYSDALLMVLLAAMRPERYGKQASVSVPESEYAAMRVHVAATPDVLTVLKRVAG